MSIHVLLQLSVFYHHHEEPCLSDWFASHHTLCLQEGFVQVNQRILKELQILHTQGGWLATQSTPPPPRISPCLCKWWQNGTRCRDGVKVLWCHSHLVRLVFEASIPTCTCFHEGKLFLTCTHIASYTCVYSICVQHWIGPCSPTPISPTPVSPTLDQKVVFRLLIKTALCNVLNINELYI